MSLRNKKTGEISTNPLISVSPYTNNVRGCHIKTYQSVNKLNEEWEDVEDINVTDIPFIKDEKVRKVVRAWAKINGIKTVLICKTFNAWGVKNKENGKPEDKEYMLADILFRGDEPEELVLGKEYTITELCGEGEE